MKYWEKDRMLSAFYVGQAPDRWERLKPRIQSASMGRANFSSIQLEEDAIQWQLIGVDVSKHVLDAQMGAHYFQVENTAKGLKKFIRALEKFIQSGNPVSTVVCEASGGYERD